MVEFLGWNDPRRLWRQELNGFANCILQLPRIDSDDAPNTGFGGMILTESFGNGIVRKALGVCRDLSVFLDGGGELLGGHGS